MLSPKELNLPEKFTDWREFQLLSIVKACSCDKYAFLLDAPTGSGKSLTAAAVQKRLGVNVVYLTTTKQLQDQILKDFPYAKTLKGRSNYRCLKFYSAYPTINAEHCTNDMKSPCKFNNRCPYMLDKIAALRAPLAVLNTAYFLSECNHSKEQYPKSFSGAPYVVLDEADSVESQLMSFVEFVITQKQLERMHIPPPKLKTKFESWIEWANPTLRMVESELEKLLSMLDQLEEWSTVSLDDLRRSKDLEKLASKLSYFIKNVDETWVWYPEADKWTFKPVWVSKYAEQALWKHIPRLLAMSATILDPNQYDLNVGLTFHRHTKDYYQLPSLFPKENRPIFFNPCVNMTFKTMDAQLPILVKAVDNIMEKFPNEKGLCLHPDTLVRCIDRYKMIKDVAEGDMVLTHKGRFRKVTSVISRMYKGNMLKIKPSGSLGFMITPNHPISTINDDVVDFIPATKIKRESLLYTPVVQKLTPLSEPIINLGGRALRAKLDTASPSFWFIVGAWVAEGFFGFPNKVKWAMDHRDLTFANRVISECNKVGLRSWYNSNTSTVDAACKELSLWLEENIGRGAHNKRIPFFILSTDNTAQVDAFVNGYLGGDGSYKDPGCLFKWGSVSPSITLGIRDLLRERYSPTIYYAKSAGGWYGSANHTSKKRTLRGDLYTQPRTIDLVEYEGLVHNLTVEEDESYCLDMVCVHNCHTVSYKITEYLLANSTHKNRLISHGSKDRTEKLTEFKSSKLPLVMVSPSMDRGVDLPEDECRFMVIAKVPFPSLGDPQIKKRVYGSKDGNRWYAYHTVSTIVQSAGRGVRSKNDHAATYILDSQFGRLLSEHKDLFPGWFLEAMIT